MKHKTMIYIALVAICVLLSGSINASDKVGEEINWQVISSGGIEGNSEEYVLLGTVGQTAVGVGSSADYNLMHGYWQDFGDVCDCEPGNCDYDPALNIFDITYLISHLYMGGPAPVPYALCSGDANCDCILNIFDITFLISCLYLGGPCPCTCEEWIVSCGPPLRK